MHVRNLSAGYRTEKMVVGDVASGVIKQMNEEVGIKELICVVVIFFLARFTSTQAVLFEGDVPKDVGLIRIRLS